MRLNKEYSSAKNDFWGSNTAENNTPCSIFHEDLQTSRPCDKTNNSFSFIVLISEFNRKPYNLHVRKTNVPRMFASCQFICISVKEI